jgi:tetratricopeptide (TPR) repeat protein
MKKKLKREINKKIEKALKKSLPSYEFDPKNTELEFKCESCQAEYKFDVMQIYFDTLHNKEKFLVEPKCPFCGENKKYSIGKNSMALLTYLYNNKLMPEAVFQDKYIKELFEKYPNENIANPVGLDDKGLESLEKGDYKEVFRIFSQFIHLNPNHHLGYEFIAYAYYENREFEKSLYFMKLALERIEFLYKNGGIDKELLSILKKNYEYMERKQLIFRWWENL